MATTYSPQKFASMYEQLSDDEQNTIVSLIENFLRKKTHNLSDKPQDWKSFIAAARQNQEELPRMPLEKNAHRVLFSDYSE